jgi:hypothetical protein
MKKLLTFASLSAIASLSLTGCGNEIGVDNNSDTKGTYSMGALETRYEALNQDYIENVFNASKKALDDLKYFRTGETPAKDKITIFARSHGDIETTVTIYKKVVETKEGQKKEWVYVAIRYGTWGNCAQSQLIVSKITANLR